MYQLVPKKALLLLKQQKNSHLVGGCSYLLPIFKDRFGDWDLPGGRIKPNEFETPIEQIILRKITEELGSDIEYALGKPEILMRHERQEIAEGNPTVRIFAIGYPAKLIKGKIQLSPQHTEMKWVDPQTFNPEEYFTDGWLKGVQEYLQLRRT